jgi:hypothetical protein
MIYGGYELFKIDKNDIDKLVFLPQVRKGENSRINEIANSIRDKGLINNPDVARLTYEGLKKHIDFINKLWGKNVDINSFVTIDGFYYVVIAGHTRLKAIKSLPPSNDPKDEVVLKLHKVTTSEEILAIQLNENIHKEISLEERAMAIIGLYHLGIESGKWHDKTEFVKANEKTVTQDILYDALAFADLPLEIQEYIFLKNIPYSVGVELGKMRPLIEAFEAGFTDSEELLEQNIKWHYVKLIMKVQSARSIKQALTILSGDIKLMKDCFRPKEAVQQEMLLFWADGPNRQGEERQKELRGEYNKILAALNRMPVDHFMTLFNLNAHLTGEDHTQDKNFVLQLYQNYYNNRFGSFSSKNQ